MSIQWIFLLVLQAQCLCAFTFLSFLFFPVSLLSFKKRVNCIVDSTVSSISNHLKPNYFFPVLFFLIVFYFYKWFSVHAQIIWQRCFFSHFFGSVKWKTTFFSFIFFEASDIRKKKKEDPPVNTFVCANRYLQACVGACVYVCAHAC